MVVPITDSNPVEEFIFHPKRRTVGRRRAEDTASLTLSYPVLCHGQVHDAILPMSTIQVLWEIPVGPTKVWEAEWSPQRR